MRILIDALPVVPEENVSLATYVSGLLKGLQKAGADHQYKVLVTPANRPLLEFPHPAFEFYCVSIDNRRRLNRVLYEQTRLPFLARRWGAEVVIYVANAISLTLSWLRIPAVVTIHDSVIDFYLRTYPGCVSARSLLIRWMQRRAARHATAVLMPSRFSAQEVSEYTGAAADKLHIVPSGINGTKASDGDVQAVLKHYGILTPYVLLVGSSNKHKNYEEFAHAFMQARRSAGFAHHLVIAGIPGSGHQDLLRALRESCGEEFAHMLGYVPAHHLPALYAGAGAFAMPSLYEGFGFPVLEAMQSGTPVLCSRAGSLPEVAGESALYFDPHRRTSMAEAIAQVLADGELRSRLIDGGRVQAAKFSWVQMAQSLLEICEHAHEAS